MQGAMAMATVTTKRFNNMDELLGFATTINNISANPYFQSLKNGLPLLIFYNSQYNFIYAVNEWSKVLGKILPHVSSHTQRKVILRNLNDENPQEGHSHVETFQQFLDVIKEILPTKLLKMQNQNQKESANTHNYENLDIMDIKNDPVYGFVKSMHEAVDKHNSLSYKLAFLGMIEFMYIIISSNVVSYMSQFIDKTQIPHYTPHELLDETHAKDLFELALQTDVNDGEQIMNGIVDGYHTFKKLYDDMVHVYKIKPNIFSS